MCLDCFNPYEDHCNLIEYMLRGFLLFALGNINPLGISMYISLFINPYKHALTTSMRHTYSLSEIAKVLSYNSLLYTKCDAPNLEGHFCHFFKQCPYTVTQTMHNTVHYHKLVVCTLRFVARALRTVARCRDTLGRPTVKPCQDTKFPVTDRLS